MSGFSLLVEGRFKSEARMKHRLRGVWRVIRPQKFWRKKSFLTEKRKKECVCSHLRNSVAKF